MHAWEGGGGDHRWVSLSLPYSSLTLLIVKEKNLCTVLGREQSKSNKIEPAVFTLFLGKHVILQ